MNIGTNTGTFTKVDIRKVVENFAADYSMIADFTGLLSRQNVENNVSDLRKFAEDRYLVRVTLYLMDKDGNPLKAIKYDISENAIGWQIGNPGNNVWDAPPGAYLYILATLSDNWWNQSEDAKVQYLKNNGFHGSWSKSDKQLSLNGLTSSEGQKYASNGYGWARTNYSK
jgi:hypothetical protein